MTKPKVTDAMNIMASSNKINSMTKDNINQESPAMFIRDNGKKANLCVHIFNNIVYPNEFRLYLSTNTKNGEEVVENEKSILGVQPI